MTIAHVHANANTQKNLLHFGKQEFLAHGFVNTSLRKIAKEAGVTTGAIYSYFEDKNTLFEAIAEGVCKEILQVFYRLNEQFVVCERLEENFSVQQAMNDIMIIFKFIYANMDEFRLLVCCAKGSGNAGFIVLDELISI